MFQLQSVTIDCPYCGESIELVVDCSVDTQDYIEDCQVCCRPIALRVEIDEDGSVRVQAGREDE